MRLYLDSNVFDHVLAAGEQERFDIWVREEGHTLLLSGEHLAEALPIPDARKRRALIALLTSVPRDYLLPAAYLHSEEVRGEIRRLRPRWLRGFPDTSRISYWLNASKRRWVEAKHDPDRVAELFAIRTRPVAEGGIAEVRAAQKSQRQALLAGAETADTFTLPGGYLVATPGAAFDDEELWWRRECLMIWQNALFRQPEVMRDYIDYLGPYLALKRIEIADFARFWLSDADRQALRRNATVSLVGRAQLQNKPAHGNALDAIHATYVFDCDRFITGDHGFFDALTTLPSHQAPSQPLLVDRSATSAVNEIRTVLDAAATP